jgi:hypothetical protein
LRINPYYTLGVPSSATEAEIKSAYQRALAQFDSNCKTEEINLRIKEVNEAYDILSNPVQKAECDRGRAPFFTFKEDVREVYRREYINRKREEERLKKTEEQRLSEQAVVVRKILYKVIRLLSFPVLGLATVLIIDSMLPEVNHHEPAEIGWQERHGRRSSSELVSYMKTEHFVMAVPDEVHVGYDYYAKKREVLTIVASPIFKIPKRIYFTRNDLYQEALVQQTIYTSRTLLYILLSSSLFIILRKNYSELNFVLCFLHVILTVYFLLKIYLV